MATTEYRARVDRMTELAIQHFRDRDAAVRWMLAANWRLGRRSPIDCLRGDDAWPTVERALQNAPAASAGPA
jgi:uncharacterized protein (DUF2384 family)